VNDEEDKFRTAIEASPSYTLAEEDIALLKRDELRGVRLHLELTKAELVQDDHNIHSTIVIFGGTRLVDADEANRRLAETRQAMEQDPDDPDRQRDVRIAERVLAKSHYYDQARELGRMVSSICQVDRRCELVVVTGGGPGIMEAANRGAFDVGAKSIGLNIAIPTEQEPNAYITPELCFQFRYFAIRKLHFVMRARALVFFPGGFGTVDELFEALTLVQTRRVNRLPIILFGREFWDELINWQYFVDEGVIAPDDLDLIDYVETAAEAWDVIYKHNASIIKPAADT